MSEHAAGSPLTGRLVLLGVTGSIAAYKSAELCRALTGAGADVQTLLSRSASAFIGALTLETLTRRRPMTDPLELLPDQRIGHIVAADSADAILVAPATARWLGAMAAGLADDVITATCLASAAPVVVAPAMDGEMWNHPATRANVAKLREFGYTIVEPEVGPLASGQRGIGRLADTPAILAALAAVLHGKPIRRPDEAERPPVVMPLPINDLSGWRVVITAGGTVEPIDPVRYIGNRSTGKMGVAVAEAALARGAQVTLIAGMTSVALPGSANVVSTPTAAEMREAVLAALDDADALVMAAAVADFRPRSQALTKIAREGSGLTLELEPTQDILAEAVMVARARGDRRPLIVGFAAETGSLERAAGKAARKGVDLMVANDVAEEGSGFGSDTNRVTVIAPNGPTETWPQMSKRQVADRLLDRLVALRAPKSAELAVR
ncbi:MAG TPA: bifunctional phosphopantothenoylcysteine decarboxylase/phosphopantothenate--cysteine ligase CoaBC [Candidatus Limnocylindrales bacterium]|nr:bifunctional phosphopantothenoylcysteine decarboxylase/phosphopantothenate--cysteine ligase CoaBC [Candidatus Limnocylindrales bacterium]